MGKYSHNHLLFLHDFDVPFKNNISEWNLRKVKSRKLEKKKNEDLRKYQDLIYRYTGYFLSDALPVVQPEG